MADIVPNRKIEAQKLKMQVATQKANIERDKYELLTFEEKMEKCKINIGLAEKVITELNNKIRGLEQAGGG